MQRLTSGRLVELAGDGVEIWLDGGHNPSAGEILADACRGWNDRPIDLIVGMMNTKDPRGFAQPLAPYVRRAICASRSPARRTPCRAEAARTCWPASASTPASGRASTRRSRHWPPTRRRAVLICGSLYLAGRVLEENG